MRRRSFVCLSGALITHSFYAIAEGTGFVRRIGLLTLYPADDPESYKWIKSFHIGVESTLRQPVRFEKRWASSSVEAIPNLVDEIISTNPEVILASTTPVVSAILRRTRDVPVVFVNVADPMGSKFVSSLSRSGGNVTGFVNLDKTLGAKSLEYLYRACPRMSSVWMMYNAQTAPYIDYYCIPLEETAYLLGINAVRLEVRNRSEIESGIARASREANSGIIVMNDSFTMMNRSLIADFVSRYKVPAIAQSQLFAREGGLLTYGIDENDCYVRAAQYVSRIFKGEKPADLPVQLPEKFNFLINNRAAVDLGLTVPTSLLAIADDVID